MYPKTQIALSALQRTQGLDPSHLTFLSRHLSQALSTLLIIDPSGLAKPNPAVRKRSLAGGKYCGDIVHQYHCWAEERTL